MTHLWNLYIRYEHELNYHQHKTEFKNINQELRYKGGQSYMTWHITLTTKFFFCFFDSSQALMYVHHNVKEFFKNSHRKVLFFLHSSEQAALFEVQPGVRFPATFLVV